MNETALLAALRREAVALKSLDDVGPILDLVGDASTVLLGEATHGSHEFYRLRAAISRALLRDKGFDAVAVEADWPDALRVSRYLQGDARVHDVEQALGGFVRFPRWMWRNVEVRELVQWLREHNRGLDPASNERVGFFGLDVYSLRGSIEAVIRYLEQTDPELARQARRRYDCFDHLAGDPQRYGYETRYGLADSCEQQVVQQLQDMLAHAGRLLQADGAQAGDELFYAQQNARVVQGAEQYYRLMYRGGAQAWNLRDTHMAQTLEALRSHLSSQRGRPARVVVWAHNSHIGDARATEMGRRGELNLGQLVRQGCAPGESFLLGFTTHAGTVAAASDWDEPVERKHVRPSMEGSIERLLHDSGLPLALVPLQGALRAPLAEERLERAIGVIYRPDTERWSHYFGARPSAQFDAVVHVDRTHAVTPLDPSRLFQPSSAEETFPSGL